MNRDDSNLTDKFNGDVTITPMDPPSLEVRTNATDLSVEDRIRNIPEADKLIIEIGAKTSDEALRKYSRWTIRGIIGGTLPVVAGVCLYPQTALLQPIVVLIVGLTPTLYIFAYRMYNKYRRLSALLQK